MVWSVLASVVLLVLLVAPSSAYCPSKAPFNVAGRYNYNVTILIDGRVRSAVVHIPTRGPYLGLPSYPAIVVFHGYGQAVTSIEKTTGFHWLGNNEGFITIYPAGVSNSWNAVGAGCCGVAKSLGLQDFLFIRTLMNELNDRICIDRNRIYTSGFSNGAMMALNTYNLSFCKEDI